MTTNGRESEQRFKIGGLDRSEGEFLRACLSIYRESIGFPAPFEGFIRDAVWHYEYRRKEGRGVTPGDLEIAWEEFHENFNNLIRDAVYAEKRYRREVRGLGRQIGIAAAYFPDGNPNATRETGEATAAVQ
jgi:hypothetical protein